ncbi:MAG: glycoside hydrolase family 28 protein [Planctomycetota bacterium]
MNINKRTNLAQNIFCISDFGAVGDGQTNNTKAINETIRACSESGGGTVWVPAGKFLTGPIQLKSNITLHIDAGARILASTNPDDYPIIERRFEGIKQKGYMPFLYSRMCENIAITGRGTIDGQGRPWWEKKLNGSLKYARPLLVGPENCHNVLIQGIRLINSPFWTVSPLFCENITITAISIANPYESSNTDGINPDSCKNVHISNCHIDVGDDCLTIKSGMNEDGRSVGIACENITVTNCTMAHGHGGVVIGSDMSGAVRNVVISNCVFVDTDRGIRIKSCRGRGGLVEDIRIDNIIMKNVLCPIVMNCYYAAGNSPDDAYINDKNTRAVDERTPAFRNIHISNMTARNVKAAAGFLYGLPEIPIEGVTFNNVVISVGEETDEEPKLPASIYDVEPMKNAGFLCNNIKDVQFHNVTVVAKFAQALQIENAENIEIDCFKAGTCSSVSPIVCLKNVEGAIIRHCQAPKDCDTFLKISGSKTRDVYVAGNNLQSAKQGILLGEDVDRTAVVEK